MACYHDAAALASNSTHHCISTTQRRRRLLLRLLPLLLLQSLLVTKSKGQQQSVTHQVYGLCNTQTYESNSTFAINLNTVMSMLTQKAASGEKYYLTQATEGSDNTSWVYGMFQCRGDVSTEQCSSCLNYIIINNYICGSVVGLRIQLLGCYLRYEYSDFTALQVTVLASNCSSQQNANSVFQADLASAINTTTSSAVANSGYYAASTVGSAHALSQCLGYLSPSDCASCLSLSSTRSTSCKNSSSGYFYYVACYYIFSDTDFLFSNSSSSSPSPTSLSTGSPSPAPGILPSRITVTPSPAGYLNIGSTSPGSKPSSLSTTAIAGISVGSVFAVLAVFCVVCVVKSHRSKSVHAVKAAGSKPLSNSATKFTVQELRAATESFHSRNKIGQGGFGVVYKGTLKDGKTVAVKIISPGENRAKQIDFMNEAKLITTVQHRNLIQLLGCGTDDSRWYLVYEYLPNRSLDLHLFGLNDESLTLDWKTRFNIIRGIARGLCYLHEDSHVRIVHRDIKAANILLDSNLEPKIADFGLARLFSDDVSHLTTAVAGTLGYMPPEYAMGGQLSEKVDVYSFGLLTLEIVSGRRVIENNVADSGQTHILEWAWDMYERKQVAEIVDKKLMGRANEWEVARAVHVALLCTQAKSQARPVMSQVYMMLCSESAILELPTRPVIMSMGIFSASNQTQTSSSSAVGARGNQMSERRNWTTDSGVATVSTSSGGSADIYGKASWISSTYNANKTTEWDSQDVTISELDGR